MKTALRRIEATLAQLAESRHEAFGAVPLPQAIAQLPSTPALHPPSFDTQPLQPLSRSANSLPASVWSETALNVSTPLSSQRSPGLGTALKMPTLPRLEVPESPEHTAKPASPVDLLSAIEGIVLSWQDELQQCLRHLQGVYAEGPIVDGWLEAYTIGSHAGQSICPEAMALSQTAKSLDQSGQAGDRGSSVSHAAGLDTAGGCRLCGFNDEGQLWFRHCPAEQVAAVSLALDRCKRMKHLLTRKQHLEAQLGKLAGALTAVYGSLTDA